MSAEKSIILFIPSFQQNHISYYKVLIDYLSAVYKVRIITFNRELVLDQMFLDLEILRPKNNQNINLFIISILPLFFNSKKIIWEEIYERNVCANALLVFFARKSILTIHNANKWLMRGSKNQTITEKSIIKIVDKLFGIITVSPNVYYNIKSKELAPKKLFYVPFQLVRNENIKSPSHINHLKIVIPGTVNSERRDYLIILKGLLNFIDENKSPDFIELVLLGRIIKLSNEERQLINRINNLNKAKIVTFNDFVPNDIFEGYLNQAHFLLGNLKTEYTENKVKEIYGESKESGIIYLMLNYRKITFMPNTYRYHPILKDYIVHYNEDRKFIEHELFNLIVNTKSSVNFDRPLIYLKRMQEKHRMKFLENLAN